MKKQDKFEALVEIRDYIRENVNRLPTEICEDFNLIAKALGMESHEGFCQFGIVPTARRVNIGLLADKLAEELTVACCIEGVRDSGGTFRTYSNEGQIEWLVAKRIASFLATL